MPGALRNSGWKAGVPVAFRAGVFVRNRERRSPRVSEKPDIGRAALAEPRNDAFKPFACRPAWRRELEAATWGLWFLGRGGKIRKRGRENGQSAKRRPSAADLEQRA